MIYDGHYAIKEMPYIYVERALSVMRATYDVADVVDMRSGLLYDMFDDIGCYG